MLMSSGLVAYSIVSLLPVELVLNVGSSAGFAMVFSLLIFGHYLERRNMVLRLARVEFAYTGRLHYGSRIGEFVSGPQGLRRRRELGQSARGVQRSFGFSAGWILCSGCFAFAAEGAGESAGTL